MSKCLLIALLVSLSTNIYSQTRHFEGTYRYPEIIDSAGEQPYGLMEIHRLKNGHYLFYLEIGRGAPNYNSGALYGRLIKSGKGLKFKAKDAGLCNLGISTKKGILTVITEGGDCGFGYGVSADQIFSLKEKQNPSYFIDRRGQKIFFRATAPEKYVH